MAKICPIDGCKKKPGLCVHDWMMIAMAGAMMILAGAHWGLHVV